MDEQQRKIDAERQIRRFETTSSSYSTKPLDANSIGRRVMVNQDGKPVSLNEKDEQFIVEHGIWRRSQKCPDEDIVSRLPKSDYMSQEPVTFWTHNLERKNFYMSASTGSNPFGKTSGMTQPADQTRAVKEYNGNIDFEREREIIESRKSVGKY